MNLRAVNEPKPAKKSSPETKGMNEICAFQITKHAISSLSLSSDDNDGNSRNDPSTTFKTTPEVLEQGKLFDSDQSHFRAWPKDISEFIRPVIKGKQIKFKPYQLESQSIDRSSEGKLVARVLPKSYAEYDTRKPTPRVDPTPFIEALSRWRVKNESSFVESQEGGSSSSYQEKIEYCPEDNAESVVILDLYMLRSAHLNQLQRLENVETVNLAVDERVKHINSLMSSVDVARNHNFGPKSSIPKHVINEGEVPRKSNTSNDIFHLHMNRPSNEEASRTLRRLELSAARKLQSKNPYKGCGKHKICKDENLATVHRLTSSRLVREEFEPNYNKSKEPGERKGIFVEMDLSGLSSADMWHIIDGSLCRNTTDGFYNKNVASFHWSVALSIPSMIMPWSNDEENGEEHGAYSSNFQLSDDESTTQSSAWIKSTSSSRTGKTSSLLEQMSPSSSPPIDAETVHFNVISNPPTILSIDTFENFTTRVFINVPLVIETKIIYASHAIVTWFAGKEVVKHDSNSYTPSVYDVNKPISILITPIRPGHDGHGCSEAYTFYNSVEPLPRMPIMELRENWNRKCGNCNDNGIRRGVSIHEAITGGDENEASRGNRLRVVTVSH